MLHIFFSIFSCSYWNTITHTRGFRMCCNGFLCVINMNLFVNYIYKCCIKHCLNTNVFYFNAICCWAACYYVWVYGLMALMLLGSVAKLRWYCCRDIFVYAPCQWETMLQCNVASHWLGAYTKWSLLWSGRCQPSTICKCLDWYPHKWLQSLPLIWRLGASLAPNLQMSCTDVTWFSHDMTWKNDRVPLK